MHFSRASGHTLRARQQRLHARRARRAAILIILASALLVTFALTAFASSPAPVRENQPAPADRLVPPGPPSPTVIARVGRLPLQLPVPEERVTAIGYHAAGSGALALDPVGRQANQGLLARLAHRVFGGGDQGMAYYQLSGGEGPNTGALNVGAPSGTAVYAPVDGIVLGLSDFVLNGRTYGVRMTLQPASAPSVTVSVTRLEADPTLKIGSTITAGTRKIGTILDLSRVERQALAGYTQDAGNHVQIEVRPALAP